MFEWLTTHTPLLYLTQSLWRDETFSVLVAEHAWKDIVLLTINDFTPPLYYMLLKIWMGIFGRSEIAIRLLSSVFHIGTVYVGYLFVRSFLPQNNKIVRLSTIMLIAFNPMLLYYAFEARVYALVVLLSIVSVYTFAKKNWKWHVVSSALLMYAHPYSIFVLISQGIYVILHNRSLIKPFIKQAGWIVLLYVPWIGVILFQISRSGQMWYYPVGGQTVLSVLGSLYLGYEGTPPGLWNLCIALSGLVMGIAGIALFKQPKKSYAHLFVYMTLLPVVVVLGISFFKPIFTLRYLIFAALSEVLLIVWVLNTIQNRSVRYILLSLLIVCTFWFNFWYPSKHPKTDFRAQFNRINQEIRSTDLLVNESALTYFNALYYGKYPDQVYLLNPGRAPLPPYVGAILIPEDKWIEEIPDDRTTYLLKTNGHYEKIEPR